MTFLMFESACGASCMSSGCCREGQSTPQELQSWVQFSLMCFDLPCVAGARRRAAPLAFLLLL